jgi:general secretion pathway protein K
MRDIGKDNQGAALITVMFVVIIAAALTVAMLGRQQLDIARTANMLEQTQAYQYTLGAEELARQVLASDAVLMPDADYPGQPWSKLRDGVALEHGTLSFAVEDLQGRFNLNTLVSSDAAPGQRFQRLLAALGIQANLLPAILSQLGTPENPRLLTSTQFLRTIDGLSADEFAALAPFITAVPEVEPFLNVNTASDTVLKAYVPDEPGYASLRSKRAVRGYITEPELDTLGLTIKGMHVKSHFFLLTAQAQVNDRVVSLRSIINREVDGAGAVHLRVISRDLSKAF